MYTELVYFYCITFSLDPYGEFPDPDLDWYGADLYNNSYGSASLVLQYVYTGTKGTIQPFTVITTMCFNP